MDDDAKRRGPAALALALSLALVAVAAWALAIGSLHVASCPAEGTFSCATLVRPALAALGPLPIAPVLALGALAQACAALLLVTRGARLPFARDAALLAALGAGFALGLQPLALLVSKRACLVCLSALLVQLALALAFARVARGAGARRRPHLLFGGGALALTAAFATVQGARQARRDDAARAALEAVARADGRVVLVERAGCPYCEALRLDVLGREPVRARLAKTGLARREAAPGEPAPVLLARDRSGTEALRVTGFRAEPREYEALLEAAER